MFVMGNFIMAVGNMLDIILTAVYWLILIRALISWVNPDPFNPIVQFLHRATEPILEPIRRLLPPLGIDLSPIVAFLSVMFLKAFLVQSIYDIALRLKR